MLRLRCLPMLCLVLATLALTGCTSSKKVARYNYIVSLGGSWGDEDTEFVPSVEVDVIGVNETEKPEWDGLILDDYFRPGNERRASATRMFLPFSNENREAQSITADEIIWKEWEEAGATHLYFLARMRRPTDVEGSDPRRLPVSLSTEFWNPRQVIEISVQPSGLVLETRTQDVKR